MVFTTWKIERTPRISSSLTWDTTQTYELTDYYDIIINTSLGSGKDTAEFKVNNVNDDYDFVFHPNDKINIYRKVNSTSIVSTDLLMNAIIQDVPLNETYNSNTLRISCNNYTETLMGAIVFLDAENLTIDEALEQSLLQIQAYAPGFAITWNTNNPSTKKDGVTSFPLVKERFYNKPLYLLFEKYSQHIKTEDGNYYYYIDKDNTLVWRPQLNTIDYTFDTSTDLYRSLKVGRDVKSVRNFVIVKGGYGPDNKPIQTRYMDAVSVAKNGIKYYYLTDYATIAKTHNSQDMQSLGITTGTMPSISLGSSYTFTTTWKSYSTGTYVVVHNDTEYSDAMRVHIQALLYALGKDYVDNNKSGKLKVDLTFKVGKGWSIGNVIQCTIPSLSSVSKNLRVQSVQYTTNEDVYSLVEDIGTI